MRLIIKEATEADLPVIKEMDRDVVLYVAGLDSAKNLEEVKNRHEEIFERWHSISSQKIYMAIDEDIPDKPLGFIWLVANNEQFTGVPYCFVMDIGIRESERRHGIGTALMKKAMEYTRSLGYDRLKLMVNGKNKNAIRFYRKLGFDVEDLYMRIPV
jgi:ribosomal protein S18 acetylase RimI-like enzyme